ncbi:MAG TPA: hypothetical protein VFI31_11130, partial [Pirellulales bacterium]|nr:hypothetical protein [Pirellulales bacterium]
MIRAAVRWLRIAAPPRWTPLALLPIAVMELIYGWLIWQWQGAGAAELLEKRDNIWVFLAFILGVQRVWEFHPLFHEDYRNWLRLTPWTSRSPLPVGPIHLLPQDALWLGLALLLWHDPGVSRLYL